MIATDVEGLGTPTVFGTYRQAAYDMPLRLSCRQLSMAFVTEDIARSTPRTIDFVA